MSQGISLGVGNQVGSDKEQLRLVYHVPGAAIGVSEALGCMTTARLKMAWHPWAGHARCPAGPGQGLQRVCGPLNLSAAFRV
jgi:hypothetical protein